MGTTLKIPSLLLLILIPTISCDTPLLPLGVIDDRSLRPAITNSQIPSLSDTKYYARFSAAVYCNNPELSSWTCVHCKKTGRNVKLVAIISSALHNTRAIVTRDQARKEIVVTFRGSINVRNIVADAILLQMTTEHGERVKVHKGAWTAMKSLYGGTTRVLRQELRKFPRFKVIIVGHSLGGMEASLFLYKLRNTKEFQDLHFALFTYGQPRVGNLVFAQWMNRQTFEIVRVVNNADVGSHVMVSGLGYFHFNTELWIQRSGKVKLCSRNLIEDPNCSNSKGPIYNVQDHLNYWDNDYVACGLKSPVPVITSFV